MNDVFAPMPREKASVPIAEAQIMELREIAARYDQPCLFNVGDLVIPRANAPIFPKDRPWIVIEVRQIAMCNFGCGETASAAYGARLDFRAIVLSPTDNRSYLAFWNESWYFEPYRPPAAAPKADAPLAVGGSI
jgi:hypothetical protein